MTSVSKTSYIDNWYSERPGTIEVGYRGRKAFVSVFTGQILDNYGVPTNSRALKLAIKIACGGK